MLSKKYTHTFPNGTKLEAFSLDPQLDPEDIIRQNLQAKPLGVAKLEELVQQFPIVQDVDDLGKIETIIVDDPYTVPIVLQPFAQVVIKELLRKSPNMFPGPIIRYSPAEKGGMTLSRANYFDFLATNRSFDKVPADYAGNPHGLPEGKTLVEIVNEGKILGRGDMVNYLGQAFFVIADGQFGFVQRAAGLGIVAGIPAVAGGTPPFDDYKTRADKLLRGVEGLTEKQRERIYANAKAQSGPNSKEPVGFFAPDFSFSRYIAGETAKEMKEEFLLEPEEFKIVRYKLVENLTSSTASTPFIATVIKTDKSWSQIADECYGDPQVIKEHPVLFAVEADPRVLTSLVSQMRMHDATAYIGCKAVEDAGKKIY